MLDKIKVIIALATIVVLSMLIFATQVWIAANIVNAIFN